MPMWLKIVLVNAVIGLTCYTSGLYLELKSTKEHLEMVKSANKRLSENLKIANQKIKELTGECDKTNTKNKIPAFLLADDPMDEILKSVGRLER